MVDPLGDSKLGQSGASIEFKLRKDIIYVRKSVAGELNSDKLFKQFLKLIELNKTPNFFRVPMILSQWFDYGFEMEYINGVTLGTFFQLNTLTDSKAVNQKIINIYSSILSNCLFAPSFDNTTYSSSMVNKIENISSYNLGAERSQFDECFNLLINYFQKCKFFIGTNHGDLSFENILIDNSNDVILIDPIKSNVETPLFDLGRLSLDTNYGWWNSNDGASIFTDLARQDLEFKIKSLLKNFNLNYVDLIAYRLTSALRVIPYTSNINRMSKLITCVREDVKLLREEMT